MKLNRKVLKQMVDTGQLNIGTRRNNSSGGGGSNTINRYVPPTKSSSDERKGESDQTAKMVIEHEARIAQLEKEIEALKSALNKTK